jgi:hypothetical protein
MPYSGGKPKESGPEAVTSSLQPEKQIDNIRKLADLIETHAPAERIAEAQRAVAESIGGDKFQVMRMLPQFMQAVAKNVDAATVYEHFRLPGRDRIVHDRREGGIGEAEKADKKKEGAKGRRTDFEIKRGGLVRQKEKSFINYLGDRLGRTTLIEKKPSEGRAERPLSPFEGLVVARFEDGRNVKKESPNGKARFWAKTEAQWKDFFSKFLDRIVAKKVSYEDIKEFLFRGLIPKGTKGIVISDMVLHNGRIEKFIRFSIIADALAKLKALLPGDVFGSERLAGLTGEEFLYLALAVAKGHDLFTSPLPAAGKFMSGQAEEKAARELGLPLPGQTHMRGEKLRPKGRRAPFTGLFDKREGEPDEIPYQFIPWWHWANLKRSGPLRWATVVFYASLLAMALIGIGVLTYRLISGQGL